MKILKTLSVAAVLAFTAANVSAQAQNASQPPAQPTPQAPVKMDPQMMGQKMTERVKQNVTGITPDQESKILAAETEYAKGMQDARTSSNGDRDAMRSKMEPLRQTRDSKIKAVLTPDQQAQYDKVSPQHPMGAPKGGN
jgi:Spy/CpxP family protein refolding chaperone